MQDFIIANPEIKIGDVAPLAGTARGIEVVITALGEPFTAIREDEDVWSLDRGAQCQRVQSRPLTAKEHEAREFVRDPRQALYGLIMRGGAAHPPAAGMQELAALSHDIRNQQTLYRDGENIVAEKRVQVYDGDDIVIRKAVLQIALPAQYAALVTQLTTAAEQDDEDWETL